jgi:sulfatase maturation enzyme AslB (radical SAM superfamily)
VTELLSRIVVPSRLALIYRAGETLGYNPTFNIWHRLSENTSEILRWLRAGRESSALEAHLVSRFGYTPLLARDSLLDSVKWCILRKLLYLDREPSAPALAPPANPLVTVYWICTQACNLRCTYCYQEATVARPKELSTEEAEGLVDQAVEAGVRTFVFTGGEPFVRRDLLRAYPSRLACSQAMMPQANWSIAS